MRFFNFRGFKRSSGLVRKPPLMHPDNVPRTAKRFPSGFHDYLYIGPTIEKVTYHDARRPALVARLIHEYQSKFGAIVRQEMTASLRDLQDNMHPETRKAARALRDYYEIHIALEQQEAPEKISELKHASYDATTA